MEDYYNSTSCSTLKLHAQQNNCVVSQKYGVNNDVPDNSDDEEYFLVEKPVPDPPADDPNPPANDPKVKLVTFQY